MARQYQRDARGRFASGGSSGRLPGGTLAARASLRRSQAKLINTSTPAQRGAVTRANRKLQEAKKASTVRMAKRGGTVARPKGYVRPAAKRGPANNVRATGGTLGRPPINNVRPYRPTTVRARLKQLDRQIKSDVKKLGGNLQSMSERIKGTRAKLDQLQLKRERWNARSIVNRRKRNVDGQVARTMLRISGTADGRKAITRRMNRALGAASRGSKPAQRAVRVYLDQLAGMGPGKPSRGRNNLRPGPRNTKGAPKRKRKGRGKG